MGTSFPCHVYGHIGIRGGARLGDGDHQGVVEDLFREIAAELRAAVEERDEQWNLEVIKTLGPDAARMMNDLIRSRSKP